MWSSVLQADRIESLYRSTGKQVLGNRRDAMNSNRLFFRSKHPNFKYKLSVKWYDEYGFWTMLIRVYANNTELLHHRRRVPYRFLSFLRRAYPYNEIRYKRLALKFMLLPSQSREIVVNDAIETFQTFFGVLEFESSSSTANEYVFLINNT